MSAPWTLSRTRVHRGRRRSINLISVDRAKKSSHERDDVLANTMPPQQPSTITLDPSQNYSITYDPNTSSLTANLPQPIPIEKVTYKQKLMLLIYFALRDKKTQSQHARKNKSQVSLEFTIVESILLQFQNLPRAKRALADYVDLGDRTDTSNGMAKAGDKSKNMVVTQEIRYQLLEWFNVVLSSKVHLPPYPQLLKFN